MTKLARVFFDVETVADYEAVLTLPEPTPPKNYKDQGKIDAWIEAARVKQVEKAALDPHTGRVAALGWATSATGDVSTILARSNDEITDAAESELLEKFWYLLAQADGRCVGWNIIPFDLPYLMVRSFALQVKPPALLPELGKYQSEPTTDLLGTLSGWTWGGSKSLKWVAKRYGFNVSVPAVDGSMIEQLTDKQLAEYVASDVELVQQAYLAMSGYFFPVHA